MVDKSLKSCVHVTEHNKMKLKCVLRLFSTRRNFPDAAQFFLFVSFQAELIKKYKLRCAREIPPGGKQPLLHLKFKV